MPSLRELATILAALRHWQQTQATIPVEDLILVWPHLVDHAPLSASEINDLCERLNEPRDCEVPGPFCCGIPGVLARMTDGKIEPTSVERCDSCQRYPSDDAARHYLTELGYLTIPS